MGILGPIDTVTSMEQLEKEARDELLKEKEQMVKNYISYFLKSIDDCKKRINNNVERIEMFRNDLEKIKLLSIDEAFKKIPGWCKC